MDSNDLIIKQIKDICGVNKKELFPKQSAKLFHKLGLNFESDGLQQVDKIKLIQSATLLNAAIVRKPENVEDIKQDLRQFCFRLLKVANAANQEADLIKYSEIIAKDSANMRKNVNEILATIPQIPEDIPNNELPKLKKEKVEAIHNLQSIISKDYTKIMNQLAGFCEEIMGYPICEYALVGLGSLVRREITPYSDFENVIVLENNINDLKQIDQEKAKEYFRWFAVIFQVILINLGETNISRVQIPGLYSSHPFEFYDDVTPVGISFDGMVPHACKFPLGRQVKTENKPFTLELIQTASKMASFIGSKEDIKNGYHLADMLMTSCFVAGSQQIYQQFQDCVIKEKELLDKDQFILSVKDQIDENKKDFIIFSQIRILSSKNNVNIKRMVYRSSTIFVSAIGKIHDFKESCCFDIVESLILQNILDRNFGCELKFAIAVACETRLRVYMDRKSQDDMVQQIELQGEFIDKVGMKSLVEYFLIIYPFQRDIFDLDHIKLSNICWIPTICYYLKNFTYAVSWANKHLKNNSISIADNTLFKQSESDTAICHFVVGMCKYVLCLYKEALLDFQTFFALYKLSNKDLYVIVIEGYNFCGKCKYKLGQFHEALSDFQTSLEKYSITKGPCMDSTVAERYYSIGKCKDRLGQNKEALSDFQSSLKIYQQINNGNSGIVKCQSRIGLCQYNLGHYNKAIIGLRSSFETTLHSAGNSANSIGNAVAYYHIGCCNYELTRFNEALSNLHTSLEIYQKIDKNPTKSIEISKCYYKIGACHYRLSQYKEALPNFKTSLEIYKRIGEDPTKSSDLSDCHFLIVACHFNLGQFEDVLTEYAILRKNKQPDNSLIGICRKMAGMDEEMSYISDFVVKK